MNQRSQKKLYRSRSDRVVAGIFGGLGEYFGIDAVVLRVAWIVVLVITAFIPAIVIYFLAVLVIPLEPEVVVHEMPASSAYTAKSESQHRPNDTETL